MVALDVVRVEYNLVLADIRLKKMIKSKVRTNQEVFQRDYHIYWKSPLNPEEWRQGKVLRVDGKLLFMREGGRFYRVSADMAVKKGKKSSQEE